LLDLKRHIPLSPTLALPGGRGGDAITIPCNSLARVTPVENRGLVTPPHVISSYRQDLDGIINTVYLATMGVVKLMIFTTTVKILLIACGGVTRPLFSTGLARARLPMQLHKLPCALA
jgi:hypothetical protein